MLHELKSIGELVRYWPIFQEGLGFLNSPTGARGDLGEKELFAVACQAIQWYPKRGNVGVITSKRGVPQAWGIVLDNSEAYCIPSAIVYAVYSNHRVPRAAYVLLKRAEQWAREQGFMELHACSRRFTKAAFRLFEKTWGFERACIVFKKPI